MQPTPTARLLIVDDEVAQMRALCDTLEGQGYEVVGRSSGQDGLIELQKAPFDILLVDLMMPGMNGIELLHKALGADPTLVAVMMSGAGTIESAVAAMQSGALDYILKPFKLSAILPVLARALSVGQLRKENAALQQRVRERTAELEAANVELEAFSRSVSHDLRNPLQSLIGLSNLLAARLGPQLPAEALGWLGMIERAGNRMNNLIEDLLRLSRFGRQALRLQRVDVNALVHSVVDELHLAGQGDTIPVVIGSLPALTADESLLRQVFVNLLSNSFKFCCKTPGPRVEVGCLESGDESVLYVRDNGVGFDMAKAQRLFDPFERLHNASDFEGSGIGLSTVHRIVQRHGGRIWADAESGQGATFFFTVHGQGAAPSVPR